MAPYWNTEFTYMDYESNLPFYRAAWDGYRDVVRGYLQQGTKHDERQPDGNTPLALACHGNHSDIVKMLLEKNCNVNNADKDRDTPIHYACSHGDTEIVKLLIRNGADVNVQNRIGVTPLWYAVYNNHFDILKILADENVDFEVPTAGYDIHGRALYSEDKSPLWVAFERGSADSFLFLILAGYNYFPEKWINDRNFPTNASDELIRLCDRFLSGPPKLLCLLRKNIRLHMKSIGKDIRSVVNKLDIPRNLRQYLLLGDLM